MLNLFLKLLFTLTLVVNSITTKVSISYEKYNVTCMSHQEAYITNKRYTNENVIWSAPKGILYGNFVGAKPAQKANLFPDKAATYFVINISIPKDGFLILKGQYPHARYFSITVANQLGEGQLGNGRYVRGDQIIPDSGSKNPFLYSNSRNEINRNYTVYIVQGRGEEGNNSRINLQNDSNILYTGTDSEKDRVHISIRTYLSDQGYDGTGNIKLINTNEFNLLSSTSLQQSGLPIITLNLPSGKIINGDELLTILRSEKNGDPNGYQRLRWLSEIESSKDKINAPCLREPEPQVFWNTEYSVTGEFEIIHPEERVRNYPPYDIGGFANNPDTKYMVLHYSFGFGEILVIRGKMPTHPSTRRGEDKLPENPEVQYFSASTAGGPPSGEGWDTLCDEQIPIDENGTYTIVVSWKWNRPKNAIIENGIGWLDPGIGEGHYIGARSWIGLLYFRFQNPREGWKYSPSNIPIPTIENPIPQDPIIMGPFYPKGEYMSKLKFENNMY
jgi:hypothetical protein